MKYCVVKNCENHAGITDSSIHMLRYLDQDLKVNSNNKNIKMNYFCRLPEAAGIRQKWKEAICSANNDDYLESNSLICSLHFESNEIKYYSDRVKLAADVIPSVFLVEIDEFVEVEDNERNVEEVTKHYHDLIDENGKLQMQIAVEQQKHAKEVLTLKNKIERKTDDNVLLKQRIKELENKLKTQEKNLAFQSSTDIDVIYYFNSFINILFFLYLARDFFHSFNCSCK